MIHRRIIGALVALLLFHLTSVGVVSACAERLDHSPRTAELARSAEHHHLASSPADEPSSRSPRAPAAERCCAAMATCTVLLIPTDGSGTVALSDVAGAERSTVRREPTTGLLAPEPPPPRA